MGSKEGRRKGGKSERKKERGERKGGRERTKEGREEQRGPEFSVCLIRDILLNWILVFAFFP